MTTNKSVNRLFLVVVVMFIGLNLSMSYLLPEDLPIYLNVLLPQICVLIPSLIYCKWKHISIPELVPYRKIKFSTGILIVVCTYLMYPLMVVVNAITMLFTTSGTMGLNDIIQGQNLVFNILFIAMIPACVEEFLFRGLIYQTYRKSRIFPAILLSGFLFGCMHMNFNQFAYAAILGIYLAFLVEATGSIFSSMLAHFILNFTSAVLSFALEKISGGINLQNVQPGGYLANQEGNTLIFLLFGIMIWFVIAIGTTAGAVAIYIAICKMNKRWDDIKQMFKMGTKERMVTISLIVGVVLTFAVMGLRVYLEVQLL